MKVITYTGKGLRNQNEDYAICKEIADGKTLMIVADGMGGYVCGAEAAKIVAESIARSLANGEHDDLASAIGCANNALASFKKQKGIENTGCTVAGVIASETLVRVFWAGDSRVYIIRDGRIIYETQDHSLVNEMKKVRVLTPEQRCRYENIVRRAIMGEVTDVVDCDDVEIRKGDEILICSDGLYKDMPVEAVLLRIRKEGDAFKVDGNKFEDNHTLIYAVV